MLPNSRLDPPAVPPRTKRNLEIAPRILKQPSEVVEFDGEKGVRRDVERCPPRSLSIPLYRLYKISRSGFVWVREEGGERERNERNEEGRTEYDGVVGRSMRGRYEPGERARFAVAAVWNGGTERAGGTSPVIKAARTGGGGKRSVFGVRSRCVPSKIGIRTGTCGGDERTHLIKVKSSSNVGCDCSSTTRMIARTAAFQLSLRNAISCVSSKYTLESLRNAARESSSYCFASVVVPWVRAPSAKRTRPPRRRLTLHSNTTLVSTSGCTSTPSCHGLCVGRRPLSGGGWNDPQ
jgi:hypothetical protein